MASKKLVLKDVRVSFPTLSEPEQYEGKGPYKFSVTALIPKGSPQDKTIEEAIEAIAKEAWGDKIVTMKIGKESKQVPAWEKKLADLQADKRTYCYADGDSKEYQGYAEHMALTAKKDAKNGRPTVIDQDRSPLFNADNTPVKGKEGRIFGGCHCNVIVELYAQTKSGQEGIRCGLQGIQYNRTGDSFGGGRAANVDEFDDVSDTGDEDAGGDDDVT